MPRERTARPPGQRGATRDVNGLLSSGLLQRSQLKQIDSNLARGNPVIVRVRLRNGITHFVVIAGKDGFDYLVRDPGAGAAKGFYPLRDLGSDIEALRFYQPLMQSVPRLAAKP